MQNQDLILILSGNKIKLEHNYLALRMEVATRLGLRKPDEFAPLWVVDFPLLEWDEESGKIPCDAPSIYISKTRRHKLMKPDKEKFVLMRMIWY